jgi:hypothetical protein
MGEVQTDAGSEEVRDQARALLGHRIYAGRGGGPASWHAAALDNELLTPTELAIVQAQLRAGAYLAARSTLMTTSAAPAVLRIEALMAARGYVTPWAAMAAAWDRTLP